MNQQTTQILQAIRTACPELMELSKGCRVYSELNLDDGIFIGGIVWLNETEGTLESWHEGMKIIGNEPTLAHLLRAIGVGSGELDYVTATDGHLLKMTKTNELGEMVYEGTGMYFDLTLSLTDNLETNPELREFVYQLVCKS